MDKTQIKKMAYNQYYEHSYKHKGKDPDNCSACALQTINPNYSGWPLIFIALGLKLRKKIFIEEISYNLDPEKGNNLNYILNIFEYIRVFGWPGYK